MLRVTTETYLIWEKDKHFPVVTYLGKIIEFLGYYPFPEPKTFGERILAKRRIMGVTQRQLAQHLGIDPTTVKNWEMREKWPKIKRDVAERFLKMRKKI